MRRTLYITFFITVILTNCDKIDNPIPEGNGAINWNFYPGNPIDYPYNFDNPESNWTTNTNTVKRILLEDYTGHTCTNCPSAAVIAKQLEDDNNGNVIVASLHASKNGQFQLVDPPEFTNDFRTTAGNTYANEMGDFFGNPAGTINRKEGGLANSVWFLDKNWSNAVSNELSASIIANIQVQFNYFEQTNGLFVHTETEFKNSLNGDYHLIIYLVRNSVIAPQKYSGFTEEHYDHHSVVSDNINGTWGTRISEESVLNGDKFYNDFSYELQDPLTDTTYEINNLSLITYLCDRNSFEVLQVIKTTLSN